MLYFFTLCISAKDYYTYTSVHSGHTNHLPPLLHKSNRRDSKPNLVYRPGASILANKNGGFQMESSVWVKPERLYEFLLRQ